MSCHSCGAVWVTCSWGSGPDTTGGSPGRFGNEHPDTSSTTPPPPVHRADRRLPTVFARRSSTATTGLHLPRGVVAPGRLAVVADEAERVEGEPAPGLRLAFGRDPLLHDPRADRVGDPGLFRAHMTTGVADHQLR